jgi:hypothetical protein
VVGGFIVHSSKRSRIAALVLVLCIGFAPGSSLAQESAAESGGLGAAAVLTSLIYGPVKLVYALGGLIVGGFAWPLSGGDSDVMWRIMNPAIRGDYVVTPAHLRGEQPLEFFGREPESGYGN